MGFKGLSSVLVGRAVECSGGGSGGPRTLQDSYELGARGRFRAPSIRPTVRASAYSA